MATIIVTFFHTASLLILNRKYSLCRDLKYEKLLDFTALTCDWSRLFLLLYEHLIIIGILAVNSPCVYPMEECSGPPAPINLLPPASVHL